MNRKPILIAVLVALSALMLVAAGCGSDKKEAANTVTVTETETTASTDTESTETESTETESTETDSGDGGSANCEEFAKAMSDVGTQFSGALSGSGNVDLEQASEAFDAMTQEAPEEIKADFQVIDDSFKKMAVALKGVDLSSGQTPDPDTLQKLQKLGTEINQAKLTAAQQHITAWVSANC